LGTDQAGGRSLSSHTSPASTADGPPGSPERRQEILKAAYDVLAEFGYRRASTLAIAQRAGASKETIYNWFGNKEGLFSALIASRADRMNAALLETIERRDPSPDELLTQFGTHLLTLLLDPCTVTINRVAIAEAQHHPAFAHILVARGRATTGPLVAAWLDRKRQEGVLAFDNAMEAFDIFIGLLTRDLQMRVLLGVEPPPEAEFIAARARQAADLFMRLFGATPL
jgi:AcrR family transcriptional regulator